MIGGSLFLQTFAYAGGGFGGFLDALAQLGFFSFVLPFLLIFALVYGLLLRVKLFEKNGINAVIALAVGLMSIQFDFVPIFFSQIFPRVGVGLAVILAVLIVVGIFVPKQNWVIYLLFGVSALTIILILAGSFESLGWTYSSDLTLWFANWWPLLFGLVFMGVIIWLIVTSTTRTAPKPEDIAPSLLKGLFGIK